MHKRSALLGLSLAWLPLSAAANNDKDGWTFHLTPYLWLPTIGGDLNYDAPPSGGGSPGVDVGPTDWLELLNGALLIAGNAQTGRFSIFTDLVYLGLESDKDRVRSVSTDTTVPVEAGLNLSTRTDFDGLSWTLAAGYRVRESAGSSTDLFAGFRYFTVEASTDWELSADISTPGGGIILPADGRISKKQENWDALIGVRGRAALGESRWSLEYYLDAGVGDSDLTWQALAGMTCSFGWGDLMLAYRHLEYQEGADGLMDNFRFTGPGFGARFHF